MSMHRVVVADGGRARIIDTDELFDAPDLVVELTFDGGRVRTTTHVDGQPVHHWSEPAGHGSTSPNAEPHRAAGDRFAHHLAADLERGLREHEFERIVLCAPAHFLGPLRAGLSPAVQRAVVAAVSHDWTRVPVQDLPQRLRDAMPDDAGLPADVP
jgi:protein required for attachment to host cells